MNDRDRRRFNGEENDMFVNNDRRDFNRSVPYYGQRSEYQNSGNSNNVNSPYGRQSNIQGGVGDYAQQRQPYPQNNQNMYRGNPNGVYQNREQGQPPVNRAFVRPEMQNPSGAVNQGYNRPPYPNRPYDDSPDSFGYQMDNDYQNGFQPAMHEQKKKRGLFGFAKQKKDESQQISLGNVVITDPKTYDDIKTVIDGLRKRQAIIVNFAKISSKDTQRILDFLFGAIYALGGSKQILNDHMYLFTPEGVTIQGPTSLKDR